MRDELERNGNSQYMQQARTNTDPVKIRTRPDGVYGQGLISCIITSAMWHVSCCAVARVTISAP